MEVDRRADSGGGALARNSEFSQIELTSAPITPPLEIVEDGGKDDGSPWSARKKSRDGAVPQHEDQVASRESFRMGQGDSPPPELPLKNLILASTVAAGIQFGWALQLSLLTPYIQTLGIGHAFSSFIWLCGPITGLVVQPCIGIWSDQCKSRWGRRRPFIVSGALMVAGAVTVIGFSADIGYILGDSKEDCQTFKGFRPRAAGVFVLGFWLLDLANNTVQGPARALLADLAGPSQRDSANAIYCLWMAVGNILGFSTGASGIWSKWFPFLRSKACCEACANLKAAFLVAVIFLIFCTVITMLYAKEAPRMASDETPNAPSNQNIPLEDASPLIVQQGDGALEGPSSVSVELRQVNGNGHMNGLDSEHRQANGNNYRAIRENELQEDIGMGLGVIMVNLLTGVRKLPSSMKVVLLVMAFCWLSWFPFFLFDTDWMGREVFRGDPQGDAPQVTLYDRGVRVGAFGLLLNSVVLAIGSLLIDPMCSRFGSKHVWALSNHIVFICMACTTIVTVLAGEVRHDAAGNRIYVHTSLVNVGALILFTVLGFPLAITYSVPYSLTAKLIADSGGGQGLAMGILNLAVVIPQMVVALGAGPWDALFGGGNQPAFALAAIFALVAGIIATKYLPRLSRHGYQRAVVHGFG